MTVAQLRKELEKYPDDMEVYLDERKTSFTYGLLNSVSQKSVAMYESEQPWDEEPMSIEEAVILCED